MRAPLTGASPSPREPRGGELSGPGQAQVGPARWEAQARERVTPPPGGGPLTSSPLCTWFTRSLVSGKRPHSLLHQTQGMVSPCRRWPCSPGGLSGPIRTSLPPTHSHRSPTPK